MKLKLTIEMDNAAFDDAPCTETARILRAAADGVMRGCIRSGLFDINGNYVGKFSITGRPEGNKHERRGGRSGVGLDAPLN